MTPEASSQDSQDTNPAYEPYGDEWKNNSAAESQEVVADTPSEPNITEIEFIDMNMEPIPDLKYRLEYDTERLSGKTDGEGKAQSLIDVRPGTLVNILVYRQHLKDYKNIGTICITGGTCDYSVVSPKLLFAIETEPHEGTPGNAEENKPPIPPTIQEEFTTPTAQTKPATETEKPKPVVSLPPAPPPKPGNAPPVQKQPTKITPGRDKHGKPLLTIRPSTVDNIFKAINPMYHIWSWWSSRRSQPAPVATRIEKPAAGNAKVMIKQAPVKQTMQVSEVTPHQAINPKVRLEQVKGQPLSERNKKYLDALFNYAEAQVLINYEQYKGGKVAQKIIHAITSHPPEESPAKKATLSKSMCFAYVRVALHQNRFVNADSGNGTAKYAGIDLTKENYQDVTATLPQVKIEYPSGHSEPQQAKIEEVKRKKAMIEAQAAKEKWSAHQKNEALQQVEKNPAPEGANYTQADLMYSLPGDIIVYKQAVPHDPDAAGHIDIRTYHGFVSDFVWGRHVPKLGGKKFDGKQYRVIGVYRKVSDEMAMVRVKAFLRILREMETEGYSDADSYFVLPDGKDSTSGKLARRKFTNTTTHPFSENAPIKYDRKDYYGNTNTAAGAYQIKQRTWQETLLVTGWPEEFTSEMQNCIAIYLLQQRPIELAPHPRRSALGYIMEGDVEKAVNETKLWNEWSCLPGGPHKAKITMEKLKAKFADYVEKNIK